MHVSMQTFMHACNSGVSQVACLSELSHVKTEQQREMMLTRTLHQGPVSTLLAHHVRNKLQCK